MGMTAKELGLTGPHLVARTIDDEVVVTEVEHYTHRRDTGEWFALIEYRQSATVTVHVPVPVARLEVAP